eukprot:1989416-Pleurochrysis_carterae.AAC.1
MITGDQLLTACHAAAHLKLAIKPLLLLHTKPTVHEEAAIYDSDTAVARQAAPQADAAAAQAVETAGASAADGGEASAAHAPASRGGLHPDVGLPKLPERQFEWRAWQARSTTKLDLKFEPTAKSFKKLAKSYSLCAGESVNMGA